jgi:hypothetical protein
MLSHVSSIAGCSPSFFSSHQHTDTPPQHSPWCVTCDALLTWAILRDEGEVQP